ncbi:MAG: hypothetical protein HY764_04020 [Candidatus Portnoybacteria bacterium]|nr:hypothetical protein [Candidatus Portnoybacteria bacterium]
MAQNKSRKINIVLIIAVLAVAGFIFFSTANYASAQECDGLEAGDTCALGGVNGTCVMTGDLDDEGEPVLECDVPDSAYITNCTAKTVGAPCMESGEKGFCVYKSMLIAHGVAEQRYFCDTPSNQNNVASVSNSSAGNAGGGGWLYEQALKLLGGVMWFIFSVLGLLLRLAAYIFNFVLEKPELQDFTKSVIVQEGWRYTRDLANMFFSLILIIIAFATILKLDSYGLKRTLPKLIIAALLINFSLVIAGVIIDFSQVLTKYFVNAATSNGAVSITDNIMNGLDMASVFKDEVNMPNLDGEVDALLTILIGIFAGSIFILIAAFVFFAAAILFIIRYISLLFLLILAPLAWLFSILPVTQKYWNQWWESFMKWILFAPAFTFFLYISLLMITKGVVLKQMRNTGEGLTELQQMPGIGSFSIGTTISFVIIIGFLLGSLIVAQKMSITGASAVVSMGQRGRRWAQGQAMRPVAWTGRQAQTQARRAGAAVTERVGTTLKERTPFAKTGARVEAAAKDVRRRAMETPEMQAYARRIASYSQADLDREKLDRRTGGARAVAVDLENTRRGVAKNQYDNATATTAIENLRRFGYGQEATQLEQARPETIANLAQREQAVQTTIREGNLNSISHLSLLDDHVVDAIVRNGSAKQVEDLRNKSTQHQRELIATLTRITNPTNQAAMNARGINPVGNEVNFAYASQTGDVQRMSPTQQRDWARRAGAEGLKRLQNFSPTVAMNIPPNLLRGVVEKLGNENGQLAHDIVEYIRQHPAAQGHTMATQDAYLRNV